MYHAIVKRLAVRNFGLVNSHDYETLLASCAPDIRHRFGGDHALGGVRRDREALRRWFHRLGRLVPSLRLTVRDTWVSGPPWNTVVVIRWTGTAVFPDGSPYAQHGVHLIRLRWGTVVEIDANEDSQAVERMMTALVEAGVDEAAEPPITS
jgi:ketosteroid isomerase-like protein